MRVPDHIVQARREQLSRLLSEQRYLPVADICRRFHISEATARRDLAALEKDRKIQRTFGGAVAFFNLRFPPFRQRLARNQGGKKMIARRAAKCIDPGMTCFFDTGTTTYVLAETIRDNPPGPLVVVTGNLSVAELLAGVNGIDVHLLGGQIVVRQAVVLGSAARAALPLWKFDLALLSAEGMNADGLWNSQEEIIEIQREALGRSKRALALLDRGKLGVTTPYLLTHWVPRLRLVTDAQPRELKAAGIPERAWL